MLDFRIQSNLWPKTSTYGTIYYYSWYLTNRPMQWEFHLHPGRFSLLKIGFFDCIFSVNWLSNSPSKIMIYNLQLKQKKLDWKFHVKHLPYPPVLLNFEKSSLKLSSKIKSISNLIFAACAACKNQVWNRLKIKFVQLDFWKKF